LKFPTEIEKRLLLLRKLTQGCILSHFPLQFLNILRICMSNEPEEAERHRDDNLWYFFHVCALFLAAKVNEKHYSNQKLSHFSCTNNEKALPLPPQMVPLPPCNHAFGTVTGPRWECSENLRHYPML
jgi:hypothetical protein